MINRVRNCLVVSVVSLALANPSWGFSNSGNDDESYFSAVGVVSGLLVAGGIIGLLAAIIGSDGKNKVSSTDDPVDPDPGPDPGPENFSLVFKSSVLSLYLFPDIPLGGNYGVITLKNNSDHEIAAPELKFEEGDYSKHLLIEPASDNCSRLASGDECEYRFVYHIVGGYEVFDATKVYDIPVKVVGEQQELNFNVRARIIGYGEFVPLPIGVNGFSELSSPRVNSVFCYQDKIYAGTNLGFSVSYDQGESWLIYSKLDGLLANRFSSVYVVGDADKENSGTVYAGTNKGLISCQDSGVKLSECKVILEDKVVRKVYVHNEVIYVGTDDGLFLASINNPTSFDRTDLVDGPVLTIYVDEQGLVYIGGYHGLSIGQINDSSLTITQVAFYTLGQILTSSTSVQSVIANDEKVYVGTDVGLSVGSDDVTGLKWNSCASAYNVNIWDLSVNSGMIYLATNQGLLVSKVGELNFTAYTVDAKTSGGLLSNDIRSLWVNNDTGSVYLGTYGGGVTVAKNLATWQAYSTKAPADDEIYSLSVLDGYLYAAFDKFKLWVSNDHLEPKLNWRIFDLKQELNKEVQLGEDEYIHQVYASDGGIYLAAGKLLVGKVTGGNGFELEWKGYSGRMDPNQIHTVFVEDTVVYVNENSFFMVATIDENLELKWDDHNLAGAGIPPDYDCHFNLPANAIHGSDKIISFVDGSGAYLFNEADPDGYGSRFRRFCLDGLVDRVYSSLDDNIYGVYALVGGRLTVLSISKLILSCKQTDIYSEYTNLSSVFVLGDSVYLGSNDGSLVRADRTVDQSKEVISLDNWRAYGPIDMAITGLYVEQVSENNIIYAGGSDGLFKVVIKSKD